MYMTGLFLLGLLDLRNPSKPVNENCRGNIKCDVDPHEAEVAPRVIVVAVHGGQESVGFADRAERAVAGGLRVVKISAGALDVGTHVLLTGGVRRGREGEEFHFFTDRRRAGHTG